MIGTNAAFALSMIAIVKTGAIAVPLSYRWNQELIHWAIDYLEADYILVEDQYRHFIQNYIDSGKIRTQLVCEQHEVSSDLLEELSKYPITPPDVEVKPEDPCTIIFTSGTTGRPKGVVSSHNAYFASSFSSSPAFLRDSRQLVATPSFHISSVMSVCFQSYLGLSLIFLPELTPESILETVETEKINTLFLPPNLLNILLPIIYESNYTFV